MTECLWEPIEVFVSRGEFDRFVAWMSKLETNSITEKVPVSQPYLGATSFTEQWFKHSGSGQVWRLVWPDGPFKGLFERVI